MVEGIILTSPALRVKPAHPIVGVSFAFVAICGKLVHVFMPAVKACCNIQSYHESNNLPFELIMSIL